MGLIKSLKTDSSFPKIFNWPRLDVQFPESASSNNDCKRCLYCKVWFQIIAKANFFIKNNIKAINNPEHVVIDFYQFNT